ncbi:MAG: AAA family ATPase [Candidatus Sumerlaeaceae bacterium]|nr:AAA family ATPase [Candidatus Sumerlaeaceae bacterium]
MAAKDNSELKTALRDVLGRDRGKYPDDLVSLMQQAKGVDESVAESTMPMHPSLKRVVHAVHGEAPTLPAKELLTALITERDDPVVLQIVGPHGAPARPAGRQGGGTPLECLEQASRMRFRLRDALLKRVLGQDAAIEMLCDAYFRVRMAGDSASGPYILTFAGPPGVGKTLLARAFAEEVAKIEGHEPAFELFPMGLYSSHQNFEGLFGIESFYKDAKRGKIPELLDKHPKAVVLLDEIEKAHENSRNALLDVLDRGVVLCKYSNREIDAKKAWFILTTNLGREIFEQTNSGGVIGEVKDCESTVFEVLAAAKLRHQSGIESTEPALSKEFVSRLAKGGAVLFRRLAPRHLAQIVQHAVTEEATAYRLSRTDVSQEAATLFTMSLLPDVDARRATMQGARWASKLILDGIEQCRGAMHKSGRNILKTLRVTISSKAQNWLNEHYQQQQLTLLIVDEDSYLPPAIESACAGLPVEVSTLHDPAMAAATARRSGAGLVLLDLSIGEGPGSPRVDLALSALGSLRSELPDLPVYLFSEEPSSRTDFEPVVRRVMRNGGARGFLAFEGKRDNPLQLESFAASIREIIEDVLLEGLFRQMERGQKTVVFDSQYSWDAKKAALQCEIDNVREVLHVRLSDRVATITFAGIPEDRFDDVVGLRRAKTRLANVLRWLREPDALRTFSVSPPRGYLLSGPPGTGKTLLARALAGEAGVPFLALSAGELSSKWVGESEERIRDLFSRARRYAPAIIFLDEIDAIALSRDHVANQTEFCHGPLNQLLACMDGFSKFDRPVFVLAATNHVDRLDRALLRPGRFDEIIPVDLPNASARRDFFKSRNLGDMDEQALDRLVRGTSGCTPAQLDRIYREACYAAALECRTAVNGNDMEHARRIVLYGAPDLDAPIDETERTLIAYHEAGHALAQHVCFPSQRHDLVTILPRENGTLGFASEEPDESKQLQTSDELRNRLIVLMAGREAERLVAGKDGGVTTGASHDLHAATRLAWYAVAVCGLDPEFGRISFSGISSLGLNGTELESNAMRRVSAWIAEAEERCRNILDHNRSRLDKLAQELVRLDSLDHEQVAQILNSAE